MYKTIFQGLNYLLLPINVDCNDMNFNICTERKEFLGTIFTGIHRKDLFKEEEREKLQDFLELEAHKIEAQIKFEKEFGIPISQAKELNISEKDILKLMDVKYSIPTEIMDQVLALR